MGPHLFHTAEATQAPIRLLPRCRGSPTDGCLALSSRRSVVSSLALVRRTSTLVPVVFLMLPVVVLFALYPGLFTLSRLAR
jgi:hypothetical protein